MDGLMTGLGYNPSSRWNSVRWVARVVWSRVAESRPCCWRPRTAAAGGRPQAGLEVVEKLLTSFKVVEKLLTSFTVESSERSPGLVGVKRLQRQLPGEQSNALAAGAWLVEFQHVRTVQELHAGGSEPVDADLEGWMRGLGGIDERQGNHREALANGLGQQPEGEGVADPGRPLVDRVEGRRCHHDGIRRRQHVSRIGLLVLRADRMTG